MSHETDLRYVIDRWEIQDKIALYGLGQDLHQPGNDDQNILAEWSRVFAPDAQIDCSAAGLKVFGLLEYAEMMRGRDLKGGGMDVAFEVWQHIEGHATVTITGDEAKSVTPHLHTHGAREGRANTFAVGYWHDRWERRTERWRIVYRRLEQLYFHTFPLAPNPHLLGAG